MYASMLFINRYDPKDRFTGHVEVSLLKGKFQVEFTADEIDELTLVIEKALERHRDTIQAELEKEIGVQPIALSYTLPSNTIDGEFDEVPF